MSLPAIQMCGARASRPEQRPGSRALECVSLVTFAAHPTHKTRWGTWFGYRDSIMCSANKSTAA
ncbi:hypothetical protein M2164_000145 [Streptomyces sp. SAI-208]|nr:hypothetical protein [Streptomyces sp. SAI-208]